MESIQPGGKYKYTSKENYEDYSSGKVLYGNPGATNFPVRLTRELFLQCIAQLTRQGQLPPYDIYDPFCGAAYSLTVLGFLQGAEIKSITASDIDPVIIEVAKKNLSLLTKTGLERRMAEIQKLKDDFGKKSHQEALESAKRLYEKLSVEIYSECFTLDILKDKAMLASKPKVDIVIVDIPYGKLTAWEGSNNKINRAQQFLDNIKVILKQTSVVSLCYNKNQIVLYEGYRKLKSIKIGLRKVILLQPN